MMLRYPFYLSIEKCKIGQIVLIYDYHLQCNISAEIVKIGKKKVKISFGDDKYRWFYANDLKPKRIEVKDDDRTPKELIQISKFWEQRELEHEQTGYYKWGAKFEFEYQENYYEMRPPVGGQSDRYEFCLDEIDHLLTEIGCQTIYFDFGYLD